MPRRPTKRRKIAKTSKKEAVATGTNTAVGINSGGATVDPGSADTVPPAEPIRHTKGRRRGPEGILDLPLDIVHAILSQLHPLDLLRLMRTNKVFRKFLLSKTNSQRIWKAALHNVEGLPECPDDLSEPAYANLAFCHQCHTCLKNCINVDWLLRERACSKCKFVIVDTDYGRSTCYRRPEELDPTTPLRKLGFSDHSVWRGILSVPVPGYEKLAVLPRDERQLTAEHVDTFIKKFKRYTVAKRKQFVDFQNERTDMIWKHHDLCEEWYENARYERSDELKDLRYKRRLSIMLKLRELGWEQKMQSWLYYYKISFLRLPEVNQPRELTERIWTRIKPKIIEHLEEWQRCHGNVP